jgi:hypothetical protein
MKHPAEAEIVASLRRTGATYEPDDDPLPGLSGAEKTEEPPVLLRYRYRRDGTVIPPTSS